MKESFRQIQYFAKRSGVSPEDYIAHKENGEKWCYMCSFWKKLDEFGIDRARNDKHSPLCLTCSHENYRKKHPAKERCRTGEKNSNWRGGRTITPHGYVLIRMPEHPLADKRGYIYEHRLVASQMREEPLLSKEDVHHKDENKHNNHPSNLEVTPTKHHHQFRHRKSEKGLRNPGEENPLIFCACGCGVSFLKFDTTNRPRKFVSGHNGRKKENG